MAIGVVAKQKALSDVNRVYRSKCFCDRVKLADMRNNPLFMRYRYGETLCAVFDQSIHTLAELSAVDGMQIERALQIDMLEDRLEYPRRPRIMHILPDQGKVQSLCHQVIWPSNSKSTREPL